MSSLSTPDLTTPPTGVPDATKQQQPKVTVGSWNDSSISDAASVLGSLDTELNQLRTSPQQTASNPEGGMVSVTAGSPSVIKDLALAPVRGAFDFAQGVYDFGNLLTANNLPELDLNPLGKSETMAGSIVESVVDFGLGFVPLAGVAGKAGKLSKLAKAANLVKKAELPAVEAASLLGRTAKATAQVTGNLTATGNVLLGAGVGATVGYKKGEERLSNLLTKADSPLLNNSVTQFLAAKEDEGQVAGRLKNAIEQLGLGAAAELVVFTGIKAVKKGRQVLAKGGTEAEADAAVASVAANENITEHLDNVQADLLKEGDTGINIKLTVTKQDEVDLSALGYSSKDIAAMKPEDVQNILDNGVPKSATAAGAGEMAQQPAAATTTAAPAAATKPSEIPADLVPELDRFLKDNGMSTEAINALTPEQRWAEVTRIKQQAAPVAPVAVKTPEEITAEAAQIKGKALNEFLAARGYSPEELKAFKAADKRKEVELILKNENEKAIQDANKIQSPMAVHGGETPTNAQAVAEGTSSGVQGVAEQKVASETATVASTAETAPVAKPVETTTVPTSGAAPVSEPTLTQKDADSIVSNYVLRTLEENTEGMTDKELRIVRNIFSEDASKFMASVVSSISDMLKANTTMDVKGLMEQASEALAQLNGVSKEAIAKHFASKFPDFKDFQVNMIAHYIVSRQTAKEVQAGLEAALESATPAEASKILFQDLQNFVRSTEQVKAVGTFAGQLLKLQQILKKAETEGGVVARVVNLSKLTPKRIEELLKTPEGRAYLQRQRAAMGKALNPADVEKVTKLKRLFGATVEWYINMGLLSSLKTSVRNSTSMLLRLAYKTPEMWVGAKTAQLLAHDPDKQKYANVAKSILNQYSYLLEGAESAWNFAIQNWRTGEDVFAGAGSIYENKAKAISAAAFDINTEAHPAMAKMADFVGRVTDMPRRFLTAQDAFVRHLNAHAIVKVRLHNEALELLGEAATKANVDEHIATRMRSLLDDSDRFFNKDSYASKIEKEAKELFKAGKINDVSQYINDAVNKWDGTDGAILQYAQDYSAAGNFQSALKRKGTVEGMYPYLVKKDGMSQYVDVTKNYDYDSFGAIIDDMSQSHPLIKMQIPFVRTPMNILYEVGQHIPTQKIKYLNRMHRQYLEDMVSGDPIRVAEAEGKFVFGLGVATILTSLAVSKKITGGGSSNAGEREALIATGWQPYSIVVDNDDGSKSYVSYQGIEPFASALGLAADTGEYMLRNNTQLSADATVKLMGGMVLAGGRNIVNHSYMAGLKNIVDAISDPERFGNKMTTTTIKNFIPNAIRSATGAFGDDPYMREGRTLLDSIKASLPMVSSDVDPKRNILGEPVERKVLAPAVDYVWPFMISSRRNDYVMEEMANLQSSFVEPKPTDFGEGLVSATNYKNPATGQTAFDRYLELTGQVQLNGRTLRQSLERLISSREYQSYAQEQKVGTLDSPRATLIRKTVNQYRSAAKAQMRQEFPDFDATLRQIEDLRKTSRQGKEVTVDDFLKIGK